jgi:hypothetical protein
MIEIINVIEHQAIQPLHLSGTSPKEKVAIIVASMAADHSSSPCIRKA